jgi:aminoglycoside/choline kinase family phosphotransferase
MRAAANHQSRSPPKEKIMNAQVIPTIDMLTAAWFTEMLRNGGHLTQDQSVSSAIATRLGEGEGMASLLWRVTLTYDKPVMDAPKSVIVKLATDDAHRLFVMQTAKFYGREVRFYEELAADAPVRVPKCLHAAIDPETSLFILILEDVGQLRHVDQLVGCGFDDAIQALRTLAKFQARWWGQDLSDLATTFIPMNDGFNQFVVPMLHQQNWPAARDARPDLWPEDVSAFLDGFVAKVPQILEGLMGPDTLIHNDYRVDNLLWDGDDIVVLDFQMSSVASGLLDFAYFVGQSIPKEVRQERFDELMNAYLSELAANGVLLDRDVAFDKYRRALVFGFMWPLGLMGGYDTLEPRGRELAQTMLERHLSAVADSDALSLYP